MQKYFYTDLNLHFIFYSKLALPWAPPSKLSSNMAFSSNEAYSKYLYKDPKHERTKYFNAILPDIYKHAHPFLLGGFSKYLYTEREKRFQRKKLIEKVTHNVDMLFAENNEASCFKFLSMNSSVLQRNNADIASKGVVKLEELVCKLEKKEEEIKSNLATLFDKNKLKAWANEQHQYSTAILEEVDQLKADVKEKLEKLLSVKKSFDRVFKGIPLVNKMSVKSRKQKENRNKQEKRKRKSLNRIQEEIKCKIVKLDLSSESNQSDINISKSMLQL